MTERLSPEAVERVAVLGAGTIGASWTALFLARGLEVSVRSGAKRFEVLGKACRARILAWRGQFDEATAMAREAVETGFAFARQRRRFEVEIGAVFFLPDHITRTFERNSRTWIFEAQRSLGGPLFPSYTFRMKV